MDNTNTKIIKIHGKNIDNFFQNIITNDINNLKAENPIYTAMLSPQGKYLYDFFIFKEENFFLLEANANKVNSLIDEIKRYDIRKDISLMLRQHIDNVDVLSFTELPDDKKIEVVATINLDQDDTN